MMDKLNRRGFFAAIAAAVGITRYWKPEPATMSMQAFREAYLTPSMASLAREIQARSNYIEYGCVRGLGYMRVIAEAKKRFAAADRSLEAARKEMQNDFTFLNGVS
jgi:hypothetical protein